MQECRLHVPTYYGQFNKDKPETDQMPEFADPHQLVVAGSADGVRIVLGSHDLLAYDKPDIQIERRPAGWAIFLQPVGGGDSSGFVYFLDDGRSFVVEERGTTPPIQFIESLDDIPELDQPPTR